jgi:hypothetical protein
MEHVDCTVTIKDLKNVSIDYEKSTEKGTTQKSKDGELGSDPLTRLSVQRLNHWINFALRYQEQQTNATNPCQLADLQAIGLNLYRILFGQPPNGLAAEFKSALQGFEQKRARRPDVDMRLRLRLVFETAAKTLGNLPWEFLFVPGDDDDLEHGFFFAGEKTELILTRCVPESDMIRDILSKQPAKRERLRILVVISSPTDSDLTTKIDVKAAESVLEQIRKIASADMGEPLQNPTIQQLSGAIEARMPHIVHFIGHGREGELALVKGGDEEDFDETRPDDPQPRWVNSRAFKSLFSKHKPRLIFLHACKGAVATSQEGFSSIARELAYAEIPAVVAMQYNISNKDAGRFARKFYEELAKGRDIDEAVKEGRLELGQVFPQWAHPRFGTPVVYLQTNIPIVLPTPADEQQQEQSGAAEERPRGSSPLGPSVATVISTLPDAASSQRPNVSVGLADAAVSGVKQ